MKPRSAWPVFLLLLPRLSLAGDLPAARVGEEIAERRSRVAELVAVRQAAEELGVRVWLFGGTAAGFAHYVRWDLAREAGDDRYRESFFDYDFTNIYRSTQDADLVADATPEQAEQLEDLIRRKMGFVEGSQDHWEVRLLRHPRRAPGGQMKLPLLGNPDFLEQSTDSNSTGMIELTDPPAGEGVVRDLRDWASPAPFFLKDVSAGRLHYYQSPTHQRTSRYLSGDNPPLFSVIRYLVKAFQYDLAVDGEDLKRVQAVVEAFDPEGDYARLSPWAREWLERYGPNLIRHSVNVEQAWNTLEGLGLREKLISLSEPSREGSLGWWLSKEPLRTRPLGEGGGKTAGELGITVVAHATADFPAYESITRDTTLRPNVLVSRPGRPGEMAGFGPGFYTQAGRAGARATGLTIRFRVDPQAREGRDFTVHGHGVVLFTNRAALEVIPESLDATLLQYFELLRDGGTEPNEYGAWLKLRRRLSFRPLPPEEEAGIAALVSAEIDRLERGGEPTRILQAWFALPLSRTRPELLDRLVALVSREAEAFVREGAAPAGSVRDPARWKLLLRWFYLPVSLAYPGVLNTILEREYRGPYRTLDRQNTELPLLLPWIGSSAGRPHPDLVEKVMQRYPPRHYVEESLERSLGDTLLAKMLGLTEEASRSAVIHALVEQELFGPALQLLGRRPRSAEAALAAELGEALRRQSLERAGAVVDQVGLISAGARGDASCGQ